MDQIIVDQVSHAVGRVLGAAAVGPESDFFALGGDSIAATAVQHELLERCGLALPALDILANPVVRDFASLATPAPPAGASGGAAEPSAAPSLSQDRILYIEGRIPGSPFFTNLTRLRFSGRYRVDHILLCLERLLRRHDILRARLDRVERGWQIRYPDGIRLPIREVDLRAEPSPRANRKFEKLSRTELATGFDLTARGPLRIVLCHLPGDCLVVLISTHHVVFDGVSRGILIGEICRDYADLATGYPQTRVPRPARQYRDFARDQRAHFTAATVHEEIEWWRRELALEPGRGPAPDERAEQEYRTSNVPVRVTAADTRRVRLLGQRHGCTLFMTMLAGFGAAVAARGGSPVVHIATLAANRRWDGFARCIGLFANTLVLRIELAEAESFAQHLRRVRGVVLRALRHESLPFEIVLGELAATTSAARQDLLSVGFALHGPRSATRRLPQCTVTDLGTGNQDESEVLNPSTFGATLELSERGSGGLDGFLQCNANRLGIDAARDLVARTVRLLTAAAQAPDARLDTLIQDSSAAR